MTGDIHAITAAHNLFAAAIDTRYYHEHLVWQIVHECIVTSDFSSFQPILRQGRALQSDHVELRNSSSAKGIWNRLCPVDKNGKREFEPTMYARLEKLGLGHKKHNPDLLTEDIFEDREPVLRLWTRFSMLE